MERLPECKVHVGLWACRHSFPAYMSVARWLALRLSQLLLFLLVRGLLAQLKILLLKRPRRVNVWCELLVGVHHNSQATELPGCEVRIMTGRTDVVDFPKLQ